MIWLPVEACRQGQCVLIIWTLSTSGLSDDGSSWQINQPALLCLPPYFLVSMSQSFRTVSPGCWQVWTSPPSNGSQTLHAGTWSHWLGPVQLPTGLCGIHTTLQRAKNLCWDLYLTNSSPWGRFRKPQNFQLIDHFWDPGSTITHPNYHLIQDTVENLSARTSRFRDVSWPLVCFLNIFFVFLCIRSRDVTVCWMFYVDKS